MGRTLHYTFKTPQPLSHKDLLKIDEIATFYNSGEFKDVWTCENFYPAPLDYYPKWLKYGGTVDSWEEVNEKYEQLEKKGLDHIEILKTLHKNNIICFHQEPLDINNLKDFRGFIKTQGNEYNSSLVIMGLTDLSMAFPKATITVHDEGEFLLADIIIKNGKARIGIERTTDAILYWAEECKERGDFYGKLIKKEIKNLTSLSKKYPKPTEVRNFCRKINVDDFKTYEGFIMSGFYGEYWNIEPNKDAEKESKKMLDMIVGALGGKVTSKGMTLEILGGGTIDLSKPPDPKDEVYLMVKRMLAKAGLNIDNIYN